MKMQDKNLALMDDIMGALNQADEWQEIQKKDPMINAADDHFNGCDAAGVLAVPVRFDPAVRGQLHIGVLQNVVLEILHGSLPADEKKRVLVVQHTHLIGGHKIPAILSRNSSNISKK